MFLKTGAAPLHWNFRALKKEKEPLTKMLFVENWKINELKMTPYCKMNGEQQQQQQQSVGWRRARPATCCFPGCHGDTGCIFLKGPHPSSPLPSFLLSFLYFLLHPLLSPNFFSKINKSQTEQLYNIYFFYFYPIVCESKPPRSIQATLFLRGSGACLRRWKVCKNN